MAAGVDLLSSRLLVSRLQDFGIDHERALAETRPVHQDAIHRVGARDDGLCDPPGLVCAFQPESGKGSAQLAAHGSASAIRHIEKCHEDWPPPLLPAQPAFK